MPPQGPADVPYRLGLTGSIGMGKTTIGGMFRDLKVPVLDSDASVHELYVQGGAAVPLVQELFPSAVVDGARANFCSCLCSRAPAMYAQWKHRVALLPCATISRKIDKRLYQICSVL